MSRFTDTSFQHAAAGPRRHAIASAIALVLSGVSLSAQANLASTMVLSFGTNEYAGTASYFTMKVSPTTILTTNITDFNGLTIGALQPASGSHTGSINGMESPSVDDPWAFFTNTGLHQVIGAPITVASTTANGHTLSMAGWNVTWNGIPSIPMGGDLANYTSDTGVATVTCTDNDTDGNFCEHNDSYTLNHAAHVPTGDASGFGGVPYGLHLEGKVIDPNVTTPTANNDTVVANPSTAVVIAVLANDIDPNGSNNGSVQITAQGSQGTAVANPDRTVTYTAGAGLTTDTFKYTFTDNASKVSSEATVTIQKNEAPVAVDDAATATSVSGLTTDVLVLFNDTDTNNNVQPADQNSVVITDSTGLASIGTVAVQSNGSVQFTSNGTPGTGTFKYRAVDKLGTQSNEATATITAAPLASDFDNPVPAGKFALLTLGSGSHFTMEVQKGVLTRTDISGGPSGGIVLDREQPAFGTHSGNQTGDEIGGVDAAWQFFSNTGEHFTKSGGISRNGDGTLNFLNKWFVTWNAIPAINMGGGASDDPLIRGIGAIACNPAPCDHGSTYTVTYRAIVPPGDPSGFGGVPYGLNLSGTVRFIDDTFSVSGGTFASTPTRSSAAALNKPDAEMATAGGQNAQCVGDCVDFRVNTTPGGQVEVVFALAGGVPKDGVYRKFINNAWTDFDTSGGDAILSAPLDPSATNCSGVTFVPGLVAGNTCIKIVITDGGLNDTNAASGVVGDPGGVGIPSGAAAAPPDTRTSSNDGCSIAGRDLSLTERGGWLAVLGFLAGMAFWRKKPKAR